MDPIILKLLINSLDDENINVKIKAIEALGKIKDHSVVDKLNELLEDKNVQIKKSAEKALFNMGVIIRDDEIPEWDSYYINLDDANEKQREFYYKWLSGFNNDKFLDIKGNLSYIFVYISSLEDNYSINKNLTYFIDKLAKIERVYGNYNIIKEHIIELESRLYNSIGEHKKALEVNRRNYLPLAYALMYTKLIPDLESLINGYDVVNFDKKYLSEFGYRNRENIADITNNLLNSFEIKYGKNIFKYFLEEFNHNILTEYDYIKLKNFFVTEEEFLECKRLYETFERFEKQPKIRGGAYIHLSHFRFINTQQIDANGEISNVMSNSGKKSLYIPNFVMEALRNEIRRILRESENIFRESLNLPKVGEGWIGETELFYLDQRSIP